MAQQAEGVSVDILDSLHEDLGVPVADIISGLRLTEKDVDQWRAARSITDPQALRRLDTLMRLRDELGDMFAGPEDIRQWVRSELRYLRGRTPQQVIREGDPERAYAAFEALASGIFL